MGLCWAEGLSLNLLGKVRVSGCASGDRKAEVTRQQGYQASRLGGTKEPQVWPKPTQPTLRLLSRTCLLGLRSLGPRVDPQQPPTFSICYRVSYQCQPLG